MLPCVLNDGDGNAPLRSSARTGERDLERDLDSDGMIFHFRLVDDALLSL